MLTDPKHLTSLTCTAADFGVLSVELLHMGRQVRFQARGSSMHPLVRDGDILLISPRAQGVARVGEIVLCTTGSGQVLVHRVIARRRSNGGMAVLVQGDRAVRPDGWIPWNQVHGRLVEITRGDQVFSMTASAVVNLGVLMALAQRIGVRQLHLAGFASRLLKRMPGVAGLLN